jgi:uncharacterized membrane protein YfcA
MTPVVVILLFIVLVNSLFALRFLSDVIKHRASLHAETGNPLYLAISAPIIFFLSALGISDFAVSTILYRMKKVVSDEKLPGTLNTQCVIPVAVMAFAFISVIQVDIVTLVVCIVAQVIGAYFGPRLVVKLAAKTIRKFISVGLLMAAVFIVASKCNWLPAGGTAVGLSGTKLGIAALCFCFFGVVNNIGIGTFPLGMATVYALGMNPAVAFPILMGAATFSIPIGSMEFIKYGQYSRKITLYTAIFGVLGVLVGVSLVKELEISMLQSLVAVILLYSGISMLMQEFKAAKAESKALF